MNFHGIVYKSDQMQAVIEKIKKYAQSNEPLIICGETGTGKELIVDAISILSGRGVVKINCAAFNANLIESELFGHEKGAFTGASIVKRGFFEVAGDGILFLDEISELTPNLQAKILRVVDDHGYYKVGGTRKHETKVRIVAATNVNLTESIEAGTFKKDLFYRFVLKIDVPPLRDRRSDIPELIDYFMNNRRKIDNVVYSFLKRYNYPGNVRELRNIITDGVLVSDSVITFEDISIPNRNFVKLEDEISGNTIEILPLDISEQRLVRAALKATGFNIDKSAGLLGLTPRRLRYSMVRLGISK